MPELPEVETLRQDMIKKIKGKRIDKVEIKDPKSIKVPSPRDFQKRLQGKSVQDVQRKGKFLLVCFDSGEFLIFHLKLTGRLLFFSSHRKSKEPDYVRVIFNFFDESRLFFADIRRFGELYLLREDELHKIPAIKNMGPDPLCCDFTAATLKQKLSKKRGKIKPALMDQKVVAGVGNIYSQEAIHQAGIHPERTVPHLSDKEIENIYEAMIEVLREAIKHRGSSVDAYVDLDGNQGGHVPYLKVYGREGDKCYRCGAPIKKKKISGRGTYFCERCQK